jgi:hypothetical protein
MVKKTEAFCLFSAIFKVLIGYHPFLGIHSNNDLLRGSKRHDLKTGKVIGCPFLKKRRLIVYLARH